MANIATYFKRYGWSGVEVEQGVWRSTFALESEEDFDLYVLIVEDWVHFAVSPLLPRLEQASLAHLQPLLLRLNQELRLARLAVDADGDVNLLADLPLAKMSFALFAQTLDLLSYYTERLAVELRRTALDPAYHSPLFA
jgi:hypothetical protein